LQEASKKSSDAKSSEIEELKRLLKEAKSNDDSRETASREAQARRALESENEEKMAAMQKMLDDAEAKRRFLETKIESEARERKAEYDAMLKEMTEKQNSLESTVASLSGGQSNAAAMMAENDAKMKAAIADLEAKAAQAAKEAAEKEIALQAQMATMAKANSEELESMRLKAGSGTEEFQKELEDRDAQIANFSKLLGKEKLKSKASQMTSTTRINDLQKQLESAEGQAQRSLADNSALRRHGAGLEANIRLATDLLMEQSNMREEFTDWDRVDDLYDKLHNDEMNEKSKKLARTRKKIEAENQRKTNMVMAMMRRATAGNLGLGGNLKRAGSAIQRLWTDDRKTKFLAYAKRHSDNMQNPDYDPLKSPLNKGNSFFKDGLASDRYTSEYGAPPSSSESSRPTTAQTDSRPATRQGATLESVKEKDFQKDFIKSQVMAGKTGLDPIRAAPTRASFTQPLKAAVNAAPEAGDEMIPQAAGPVSILRPPSSGLATRPESSSTVNRVTLVEAAAPSDGDEPSNTAVQFEAAPAMAPEPSSNLDIVSAQPEVASVVAPETSSNVENVVVQFEVVPEPSSNTENVVAQPEAPPEPAAVIEELTAQPEVEPVVAPEPSSNTENVAATQLGASPESAGIIENVAAQPEVAPTPSEAVSDEKVWSEAKEMAEEPVDATLWDDAKTSPREPEPSLGDEAKELTTSVLPVQAAQPVQAAETDSIDPGRMSPVQVAQTVVASGMSPVQFEEAAAEANMTPVKFAETADPAPVQIAQAQANSGMSPEKFEEAAVSAGMTTIQFAQSQDPPSPTKLELPPATIAVPALAAVAPAPAPAPARQPAPAPAPAVVAAPITDPSPAPSPAPAPAPAAAAPPPSPTASPLKPAPTRAPAPSAPKPITPKSAMHSPKPPKVRGPTIVTDQIQQAIRLAKSAVGLKHDMAALKQAEKAPSGTKPAKSKRELHQEEGIVEENLSEINEKLEEFELTDILGAIEMAAEVAGGEAGDQEIQEIREVLQASLNTADLKEISWKLATLEVMPPEEHDQYLSSVQALSKAVAAGNVSELQTMAHELSSQISNNRKQIETSVGPADDLRQRDILMSKQKEVLEAAVKTAGGWRSAVFLENGEVDVDVDISVWNIEDQVSILAVIKDQLLMQLMQEKERAFEALKSARSRAATPQKPQVNLAERAKQEKLHKQIRSLYKKASSYGLQQTSFGSNPPSRAASRGQSNELEAERKLLSTAGSEASAGSFASAASFGFEPSDDHRVLENFHDAPEHEVHATLDADHDHVEQIHGVFEIIEKDKEEIDKLKSALLKKEEEFEELKKAAEHPVVDEPKVDPAMLNELEMLRGKVDEREKLMAQLKKAIEEKELEAKQREGDNESLQKLLRDGAEREASKESSGLEQLMSMKDALEQSEKTTYKLKERIMELELGEQGFQAQIQEYMRKEKEFEQEMSALLEKRKADEWALRELEEQIMAMGSGDGKKALENLRRKKQREFGEAGGALEDLARRREDNLLAIMKSYQWVHHVPQVSFNGVPYSSIVEFAEVRRSAMRAMAGMKQAAEQPKKEKGLMDELHLEGKMIEKMRQMLMKKDLDQYFDGGGVFFVTSDIAAKQSRSRRNSFEANAPTGGAAVQYRHAADVDKQPYGPWGRHPQLRYPYSDPGKPGDGHVEVTGENKGKETKKNNAGGRNDGFKWSSSFAGARKTDKTHGVKRVQQTYVVKKKSPEEREMDRSYGGFGGRESGPKLPEIAGATKEAMSQSDPFGGAGGFGRVSPMISRGATPQGMPAAWEGSRPGTTSDSSSMWNLSIGDEVSGVVHSSSMSTLKGGSLSLRG
jgi:hypothetical protein